MRVAFLTTEYPSEDTSEGGLATYVQRMAHLLRDAGHTAEIFLPAHVTDTRDIDGVVVHRVDPEPGRDLPDAALGWLNRIRQVRSANLLRSLRPRASALAAALKQRHGAAPFDLVQSADYMATGLFVERRRDWVHVIRCSSAADLYDEADGPVFRSERLRGALERRAMRRADVVYAPSRLISEHFRVRHAIDVKVIRPPLARAQITSPPTIALPDRYLVHFGQLLARKGSDFIARALPLAWLGAPDLKMVWSGVCRSQSLIDGWRERWGDKAGNVLITGPLERRELLSVVAGAEASVLPSQVDNLPNTVIESLSSGVPVIGTYSSSIDEIVEDRQTGHLLTFGDTEALASAMVEVWRGHSPARKGFQWAGAVTAEMQEAKALQNFLALADRAGT